MALVTSERTTGKSRSLTVTSVSLSRKNMTSAMAKTKEFVVKDEATVELVGLVFLYGPVQHFTSSKLNKVQQQV